MGVLRKYLFIIVFLVIIGVIFIGLIIYGSQIQEIKPGDGFSFSFRKIKVFANNQNWQETGISVKELSKKDYMKINISGDIYLCGGADKTESLNKIIHSTKCLGGLDPNYPSEAEFLRNADKKSPYKSYSWDQICPSGFDSQMKYDKIDNMKISKFDILEFRLIPKQKIVTSCENIPEDIIFANTNALNKSQCRDLEMQNQKIERIFNNDPSPFGNKVFVSRGNLSNWFLGSFADFRFENNNSQVSDVNLKKEDLKGFSCKTSDSNIGNFLRFETFDINSNCRFFAHDNVDKFGVVGFNKIKDNEEYAELLIGKIGGNSDWDSKGKLCVYGPHHDLRDENLVCPSGRAWNSSGIMGKSIRLNFPYEITKDNIYNDDLFLIFGDDDQNSYSNNLGGYNVSISHSCPRRDGNSLFIFAGKSTPDQSILFSPGVNQNLLELVSNNDGEVDITSFLSAQDPADKIFFIIKDNGDGYQNNSGFYDIELEVESVPTLISEIMRWLIDPIKEFLGQNPKDGVYQNGIVKDFYDGLINNGIREIVRYVILIFIVITSLSFVLGITEMKFSELLKIILKISFIIVLLTDASWSFLNKNFFNMFWFGAEYLVSAFAKFFGENQNYDYNSVFIFFDKSVGYLFHWQNLIRFLSLICSGFYNQLNWFIAILIGQGLLNILSAFFRGIILYVSSLIVSGFLIAISPIFICFILFKNTYQFFDTWIKQLIMYTTVPALFFIVVGFLNEILFFSIFQIFNFGCYTECLLPISFGGGLDICILNFPMPFANNASNFDMSDSYADMVTSIIPISFMHVINFMIISQAYLFSLEIIPILASMIFGGSPRFSVTDVANNAIEAMKYTIGMDKDSQERRRENKQGQFEKGNTQNKTSGVRVGFRNQDK